MGDLMLYNTNLLGFISEDLWDIKQAPDGLVKEIRVHSLYSGAGIACRPWNDALAGDRRMKPLLYIFPRSLSPDSQQWVCRPPLSLQIHDLCGYSPISYQMIYEPESNSNRAVSGLSRLDAKLGAVHPSIVFLRLAEGQQPLFSNLQELDIDTTDTSILLLLASPLPDDHFPFGCRGCHGFHLCGWKLRSFPISCVPDGRNYPRS
ncbi:hypothetical protein EV421DRAFT_95407 [Armillaria borealis]|uniref:Uncharacterized protein n=1 Tax=Armillaria borealis TaxID=47425 RepID=A0AA39N3R0_9AGAR|nr:hypothetical protein EV421DRAFT_95407 [Armillaria borealis]